MSNIKHFITFIIFTLNLNIAAANEIPEEMVAACGEMSCEQIFSKMKKFARGGSPHAQAVLALFYREGYTTDVDSGRSVSFMKKAARAGLDYAQYDLSMLYRNGYLVEKNQAISDSWLQRSGEAGYKKALQLLVSENKISAEDKMAFEEATREPAIGRDDVVLTIVRDKYTLTDLVNYLASMGYGRSKSTGSRMNGRGCGRGISNCASWKVNSPLGRAQFDSMISTLNAIQTTNEMAGMNNFSMTRGTIN